MTSAPRAWRLRQAAVVVALCAAPGCASSNALPSAIPGSRSDTSPKVAPVDDGRPPWAIPPRLHPRDLPTTSSLVFEDLVRDGKEPFLGGAVITVIDATPEQVMDALQREDAFWHVLPNVNDLVPKGKSGGDTLVSVTHGEGITSGTYVLRVHHKRDDRNSHLLTFHIDQGFDHDVDDAWGYFRIQPLGEGKSVLVFQIRIVLSGLLGSLFGERVHDAALTVADRTRDFVKKHLSE